jgi:hypothetical protein
MTGPDQASDERVDRLYALPLDEFTAGRNALAKELRKEGDREGAEVVKALKKPSVEAWMVNQLARQHRDEVARLVELGEEQPDVLASGDRERLRQAMGDVRGTLTSLANHAERILGGSDRKPTSALLERVTRMLQNAASTDDGRAALREGRFTVEAEPADLPDVEFPALAPRRAAAPKHAPAAEKTDRAAEKKRRAEEEAERARLEHLLRRAEEHARLLKDKAEDLERRAVEAREAAVAAEEAAEAARESLVAYKGP